MAAHAPALPRPGAYPLRTSGRAPPDQPGGVPLRRPVPGDLRHLHGAADRRVLCDELHRLRAGGPRVPAGRQVHRDRQLPGAGQRRDLSASRAQHGPVHGLRRRDHARSRPRRRHRREPRPRQVPQPVPGGLLPARGHQHRGHRGHLALLVGPDLWLAGRWAAPARPEAGGLAGQPGSGLANHHRDRGLAQPGQCHGALPGRSAGDPARATGGGQHRRGRAVAGILENQLAIAAPHHPLCGGDDHQRVPADFWGGVRHYPRRTAQSHPVGGHLHVPAGVQLLPSGLRQLDRVRHVRGHRGGGGRAVPPVEARGMSVSAARTVGLPRARTRRVGPARRTVVTSTWWVYVVFLLGLVLVAGPFVWMVASSFKDSRELHAFPPTLLPARPTLDNYTTLFQKLDFPLFFFNSLLVAAFVVGANLLFCSMLGYALAKLHFVGRDQIFLLVMATLMVPSTVTLVPLFVLMSALGLVNSYPALILPFAAGPFGVFLMRQFMLSIPNDLLEAARIDGASELGIFFRVVLPISHAPLATLGILPFLASWNNFIWPLIVS